MFNPLTQTQKDDAINVFNKPFESLTLEEAFHLGALLKEIELSNNNETEIKLPDIFVSSLIRVKSKEELEKSILRNAIPFKHNGKFYKLYKVDFPTLSYRLYNEPKSITASLINQWAD